jgi:hypothetical protein
MNTRNARGTLAVDQAIATLDQRDLQFCNVAWIRVWGEPRDENGVGARDVSMSWWLSKPVQVYLHEQTDYRNGAAVGRYSENRASIGYALAAFAREQVAPKPARGSTLQCPQSDKAGD